MTVPAASSSERQRHHAYTRHDPRRRGRPGPRRRRRRHPRDGPAAVRPLQARRRQERLPRVGAVLGDRELGTGAGTGAGRQAAGRGPVPARHFPTGAPRWSTTSRTGATGSSAARRTGSSSARSAAPRVWFGLPFGAGVWGSGYVVLPAAGLYQPIWEYDRRTLANDLSAHLVYGLTTAAVFRVLVAPRRTVDMTVRPGHARRARALRGPAVGHASADAGRHRGRDAEGLRRAPHLRAARRLAERPDRRAPPRRRGHVAARPARGGGRVRGGR